MASNCCNNSKNLLTFLFWNVLIITGLVCAQTEQDYAVDTYLGGEIGQINLPSIPNVGGEATFEIQYKYAASSANVLFELGKAGQNDWIFVELRTNEIWLRLGPVDFIPKINNINLLNGAWRTISISIKPLSTNQDIKVVKFYVDGTLKATMQKSAPFPLATRSGTLGARSNRRFLGLLDNFIIWDVARTDTQISSVALRQPLSLTSAEEPSVIAWWSFNEGFGGSALAFSQRAWLRAELVRAFFRPRAAASLSFCQSYGDPHIYGFNGQHVDGGEQQQGTIHFASCRDIFEMRYFLRYTPWWGATVARTISWRIYDSFYHWSLEENPALGNWALFVRRYGAYKKTATTGWVAVPPGSYDDPTTGVFFYVESKGVKLVVPRVGYVTAHSDDGRFHNIQLYMDLNYCQQREAGVCDRKLANYKNLDFEDWKYPVPPADPTPPPILNYCETNSALQQLANQLCSKFGQQGSAPFEDCVFDICASGDPELTMRDPPTPQCLLNQLYEAQGLPFNGTSDCLHCPNDCSKRGICQIVDDSAVCDCDDGWTGSDCGQRSTFSCYDVSLQSDTKPRKLQAVMATFKENIKQIYYPPFRVEDSITVFLVEQPISINTDSGTTRFLVITNDIPASNDGGSYSLNLKFDVATNGLQLAIDEGYLSYRDDPTGQISINFNWMAFKTSGAVISKLPDTFDLQISITQANGIQQVLVGSGSENPEVDVMKVHKNDWFGIKIKSFPCQSDECANVEMCKDCAALAKCGFCVDTQRCQLGDNVGPRAGNCRNWRYSFDDNISRRVTSVFGWPLSPRNTEVFLTTAGDSTQGVVPLDFRVNMGNPHEVWDVVLMLHESVKFSDDLIKMQQTIETKLLPALQQQQKYPEIRLGIGAYSDQSSKVRLLQDLISVESNNQYVFKRALNLLSAVPSSNGDGQLKALLSLTAPGVRPSWRNNARRMVILTAVNDYCKSGCSVNTEQLVEQLLKDNVLPVFAPTSSLVQSFESLVTNTIQFGLVERINDDGSNIHTVIEKVLRKATGSISMVKQIAGHIDNNKYQAETMNIFGLRGGFRARFIIPFAREAGDNEEKVAKLIAPGFGETSIVDIPSELPWATTSNIIGQEDTEIVSSLTGQSYKGLLTVVPVIKSLPTKGTLYNVDGDGKRSTAVVVDAPLTSFTGRVMFVPQANEYSWPSNAAYTTFTYLVTDGCAESAVKTVKIDVHEVNDKPYAHSDDHETNEDTPLNFVVKYGDVDVVSGGSTPQPLSLKLLSNPSNSLVNPDTNAPLPVNTAFSVDAGTDASFGIRYVPTSNFFGTYTFTFVAVDNQGASSDAATVTITVHPVNDAPTASIQLPIVGLEDSILPITLRGNDIDSTTLSATVFIPGGFKGKLFKVNDASSTPIADEDVIFAATQSNAVGITVYYLPLVDEFSCAIGSAPGDVDCSVYAQFSFKINDNHPTNPLVSNEVQVPVHVRNVNDRPIAESDTIVLDEDTPYVLTLVSTDIDNDDDSLVHSIVNFPQFLSLLQYDDLSSITSSDPDVDPSGMKRIRIQPSQDIFGNPDNGYILETFTHTARDPLGAVSIPKTITVIVNPVNDAPIAQVNLPVHGFEDERNPVVLSGFDVDSFELSVQIFLPVDFKGQIFQHIDDTVALADGSIISAQPGKNQVSLAVYYLPELDQNSCEEGTPAAECNSLESFYFRILDNHATNPLVSDTLEVPVVIYAVNDEPNTPVANNVTITLDEDTEDTLILVATDIDTPLPKVKITIITFPDPLLAKIYQYNTNIEITAANPVVADGLFRVDVVLQPNVFGDASNGNVLTKFYYKANDGALDSNIGIATIVVNPVNDAPVAQVGSLITGREDKYSPITLFGTDIDSDELYAVIVIPEDFEGTLHRTNETGNPALNNGDSVYPSQQGSAVSITVYYLSALNAHSCEAGNQPGVNCGPLESFSFYIKDVQPDSLNSNTVNVSVYVFNVNDEPTLPDNINITIYEDSLPEDAVLQISFTDIDTPDEEIDLLIATFPAKDLELMQYPDSGIFLTPGNNLITDSERRLILVPAPNVHGQPSNGYFVTSFTFQAFDQHLYSDIATVTVNILPVNDAPVADAYTPVKSYEDKVNPITLTGYDIDSNTLVAHIQIDQDFSGKLFEDAEGTVPLNFVDNVAIVSPSEVSSTLFLRVYYQPPTDIFTCDTDAIIGQEGCDPLESFTYWINDTHPTEPLGSNQVQVPLYVFNVNDPPITFNIVFELDEDEIDDVKKTLELQVDDIDTDLSLVIPSIVRFPDKTLSLYQFGSLELISNTSSVVLDAEKRILLQTAPDVFGDPKNGYLLTTFTYKSFDGQLYSNPPTTVSVICYPVNDAPVGFINGPIFGHEDLYNPVILSGFDIDSINLGILVYIPEDFKGQLFIDGESEPISNGTLLLPQTETNSSKNIEIEVMYLPPHDQFTCTEGQQASDCEPIDTFYFQVDDRHPTERLLSNLVQVPVVIYAVNDAPVVTGGEITVHEDEMGVVQLLVDDVDNLLSEITLSLVSQPSTLLFNQYDTDETVVEDITDTGKRVKVTPISDAFGDQDNNWFFATFTFTARDGKAAADEPAVIVVNVIPVNDAPIATLSNVAAVEDTRRVILLTATDIDTPQSQLKYWITAIPDPDTEGKLYLYDASNMDGNVGELITEESLPMSIELGACPMGANNSSYKACVVFEPALDHYGDINFSYKVEDVDVYGTSTDNLSDEIQVVITIAPVNEPPVAAMDPPIGFEDELLIITLDGYDKWNENDPLMFVIVEPLFSGLEDCNIVGKMYQFDESLTTISDYEAQGIAIEESNTTVDDPQGRIAYIPPLNYNTETFVPFLKIAPQFVYKVKEIESHAPPEFLESNLDDGLVTITILEVNDAPIVWQDEWISHSGADACFSDCVFDEDLGVHWTSPVPGVASIYLGGNDIEKSPLFVFISSVTCPEGAILTSSDGSQVIPRGEDLFFELEALVLLPFDPTCGAEQGEAGNLNHMVSFTPALDATNYDQESWYCKLSYFVQDINGAQSETKTITISLSPANDVPRPSNGQVSSVVMVDEDTPTPISFTGLDPESDSFSLILLSCEQPNSGTWTYQGQPISCFEVLPPSNGNNWDIVFTPNENEYGERYNYLVYSYLDNCGSDCDPSTVNNKDKYSVQINVVPVNDHPVIVAYGSTEPKQQQTATVDTKSFVVASIEDVDLYPLQIQGQLTVEVSVAPTPNQQPPPQLTDAIIQVIYDAAITVQVDEAQRKIFAGTQAAVNKTLDSLTFEASETGKFTLYIRANDNGYTGKCVGGIEFKRQQEFCNLEAVTTVDIEVSKGNQIQAAVAAGAAAASLIAAGAVGAGLWRKFGSKKRDEKVDPWDIGFNPEAPILSNPMYQDDNMSGTNPLFEE